MTERFWVIPCHFVGMTWGTAYPNVWVGISVPRIADALTYIATT